MKYLLLVLLLSGCATTKHYECSAFNGHGVYAKMKVSATNQDEATAVSSKVVKNLMDHQIIPDNCAALCFEEEKEIREYPRGK